MMLGGINMILAIAKNEDLVHGFFGSCDTYELISIENNKVVKRETIFNDVDTHKLRPAFLKSLGVDAVMIKGLGLTAYDLLNQQGIEVYTSDLIPIEVALQNFIDGKADLMPIPGGAHC